MYFLIRLLGVVVLLDLPVAVAEQVVGSENVGLIEMDFLELRDRPVVILPAKVGGAQEEWARSSPGNLATSSPSTPAPPSAWRCRGFQDPDHQPFPSDALSASATASFSWVKKSFRGRRSDGELVVRHGERGVLGGGLLEQLAPSWEAELLGQRASLR